MGIKSIDGETIFYVIIYKKDLKITMQTLKTIDFDYTLPEELIAQEPSKNRPESRLMVVNSSTGNITHHLFKDITNLLDKDDTLIFNNSKVINARLLAKKLTGAKIELFLLQKMENDNIWKVLIKNVKKCKEGETLYIAEGFSCKLLKKHAFESEHIVEFSFNEESIYDALEKYGQVPLPPYIQHASSETANLFKERYQTVFAQTPGAVAAPTAGLHFDPQLIKTLENNHDIDYITLHVGYGTFKPISTTYISEHIMHEEIFHISEKTSTLIERKKQEKKPIVAVGTTVARALETGRQEGTLKTGMQQSELFISPGYEFKCIDKMITNFHLPKSSLLVLVSSLAGVDLMREAYHEAIKQKYRFYSFGDAMLITH